MAHVLDKIAEQAVKDTVRDSYYAGGMTPKMRREALGVLISQWVEWAGYQICEVFLSALEDSNFHTLAADIEDAIERDKKRR